MKLWKIWKLTIVMFRNILRTQKLLTSFSKINSVITLRMYFLPTEPLVKIVVDVAVASHNLVENVSMSEKIELKVTVIVYKLKF